MLTEYNKKNFISGYSPIADSEIDWDDWMDKMFK